MYQREGEKDIIQHIKRKRIKKKIGEGEIGEERERKRER